MRRYWLPVLAFSVACGGDKATAPLPSRQVDVVNYLYVPVAIAVDGVPYGSISAYLVGPGAITLQLPGDAKTVRWVPGSWAYANGGAVPSDLTGEMLALPSGPLTLGLNNFVGTQPYIAFRMLNTAAEPIGVGIFSGGATRCLGSLPDLAFQWYGYYVLSPDTEVRVFHGTNCTGAYLYWSAAQLNGYQANSGTIQLQVTSDRRP